MTAAAADEDLSDTAAELTLTPTNIVATTTPDPLWLTQLFEYLSFKAENPNIIPQERDESYLRARQIGLWVKEQSILRHDVHRGVVREEDVMVSQKKILVLESLPDFPWRKPHEERNQSRFEELKECAKKYSAGSSVFLTDELVEDLESIGFEWSVKKSTEEAWESKYAMLCDFKKAHGHCNVPRYTDGDESLTSLGRWVVEQQKSNKENSLSEERATKLNKIGFKWSLRK
ncbi:hypothetical protein HJC23_006139 [Cyclotella cryptica]|uniref:Helicase-associated domain-containing protein n=1 Tax=Cyclotella cryptica TaxID=29204 RepID=A0ABD3QKR2_9STRA